jgi:hypothetical protein
MIEAPHFIYSEKFEPPYQSFIDFVDKVFQPSDTQIRIEIRHVAPVLEPYYFFWLPRKLSRLTRLHSCHWRIKSIHKLPSEYSFALTVRPVGIEDL